MENQLDQIIADAAPADASNAPAPSSAPTQAEPTPAPAPVAAPAPEPAPQATPSSARPIEEGDAVIYFDYADVECDRVVKRAAFVTKVWGPSCVNLLILGERGEPVSRTSVCEGAPGQAMSYARKGA